MAQTEGLKRTPLYLCHVEAGARLVDFAGWEMPVQYAGVIEEHRAVRTAAGLFDVSHMGEIRVEGPGAEALLQRLTPNDVAKLAPGRAHYSGLLTERGTYVDDLLVYRLAADDFLVVVNASNAPRDHAWIAERAGGQDHVQVTDEGRKRMKQAARGLRHLVPEIDLLATSPLTRAAQTAAILDAVYGGLEEVEIDELTPEASPADFLRWLRQRKEETVAVVGHEPSISLILSWLLTGAERQILSFRKGGACLVEFPGEIGGGTATLLWALTPGQLREIGD